MLGHVPFCTGTGACARLCTYTHIFKETLVRLSTLVLVYLRHLNQNSIWATLPHVNFFFGSWEWYEWKQLPTYPILWEHLQPCKYRAPHFRCSCCCYKMFSPYQPQTVTPQKMHQSKDCSIYKVTCIRWLESMFMVQIRLFFFIFF